MSYPTFIIKEYLKNNYFPGSSAGEESTCNAGDPGSIPGSGISFGVGSHSSFLGLPWWLRWQRILLQCGRPGFDPWVGKIPGEGNSYPLQYSCLENSMDRGAWRATVHGVAKSRTWLCNFHLHLGLYLIKAKRGKWGSRRQWATPSRREAPGCQWCGLESGSRLGGWGWGTPTGHSSRRRIWRDRADTGEGGGGEDVNKANP